MKNTDSPFRDIVGIVDNLERATNHTMSKRQLYRVRKRLERRLPGRWFVEYRRMLEAGVIRESGTGKRGSQIIVSLSEDRSIDESEPTTRTPVVDSVSGTH